MKQLLLNLNEPALPTLDTFVVGRHTEIIQLLRLISERANGVATRTVYIWGETGVGKSHLLRALAQTPDARLMDPSIPQTDIDYTQQCSLYLLDDCQRFDEAQQVAAFNLFNQVKEHNAFLVASGSAPPAGLMLREDLRTRLGWGLVYQLHALSDEEKIAALTHAARARDVDIPSDVLPYLMTHFRRDMPSLARVLNNLIDASLESKRKITLPLLRELMH
jgi:DnaA family protein